MSTLILVRHAQASFGAADYDQLSPLGETQSTLLGGHWVNAETRFDTVFIGPRKRHRQTAEGVARVYRDAGFDWPEPLDAPALDEYQGEELLKLALPRLASEDVHLQTLMGALSEVENDRSARRKAFQKVFEHVMRAWVRGEISEPGVEPWADFRARVAGWVEELLQTAGRGRRVVAFTSGGFVAGAAGYALGLDDVKTIELSWMVNNAALAEFTFNEERFTLSRFNALPHLQYPRMITYR